MEIFGKLKMSMGHISCTGSGHLEKERSKSVHRDKRTEMAFSKGTERVIAALPQDDLHRWQWAGEGLSLPGGHPCGSDLLCYKY